MSDEATAPSPMSLYRRLHGRYGELGWWPGEGPFDVLVGAILTQRMNWRTVEVTILRLRAAGVTDVEALLELPRERLEELIRPTGTYRQKAERLRALCSLVSDGGGRTLEEFLSRPRTSCVRSLLPMLKPSKWSANWSARKMLLGISAMT